MLGRLKGAGIICITVHPRTKEVMFLLAKERETVGWKQGSFRWSFLGGSAKPGEDIFECAHREFFEESLGVVRFYTPCTVTTLRDQKEFAFLVTVNTKHMDEVGWRHEVVIVKFVPWQPNISRDFQKVRHNLLGIRDAQSVEKMREFSSVFDHPAVTLVRCPQTNTLLSCTVNDDHLEISEVRWWRMSELDMLIRRNGYYIGEKARISKLPILFAVFSKIDEMMKMKKK